MAWDYQVPPGAVATIIGGQYLSPWAPPAVPPELFIANVDYNAAGQPLTTTYGSGTVTTHEYDAQTLRLTRIRTLNAASRVLQDLTYTYDSAGQIKTITDNVNTATQAFQYDHLNLSMGV